VAYQEFFSGGVQHIQLRTEGGEYGDLGAVPLVRGSTQFENERNPYSDQVVTDVRYIPQNWEFGSALPKLQNFGGWLNPPPPYATVPSNSFHVNPSYGY
jgi:hypothetical protein